MNALWKLTLCVFLGTGSYGVGEPTFNPASCEFRLGDKAVSAGGYIAVKTGKPETVQTAIRRQDGHTIYEVFFPKREIVPIEPKPGASFGFAILVNDKDHDYRKQGLSLTPVGMEPYMNPHLWPLWVLER